MSNFIPSEKELVVNPITGGIVVGKNVGTINFIFLVIIRSIFAWFSYSMKNLVLY